MDLSTPHSHQVAQAPLAADTNSRMMLKSTSKRKLKSPAERMSAYREAHSSEEFRRKGNARKKKAHELLSEDKLEAS